MLPGQQSRPRKREAELTTTEGERKGASRIRNQPNESLRGFSGQGEAKSQEEATPKPQRGARKRDYFEDRIKTGWKPNQPAREGESRNLKKRKALRGRPK